MKKIRRIRRWIRQRIAPFDGLSSDGLSFDGLNVDGLSVDGLSVDGLSVDGLPLNRLNVGIFSTFTTLSKNVDLWNGMDCETA
jgi:hypothetical protein